MSTLSVTTINTANGTTDLIMTSGNTAGGKVVVSSGGGVYLQGNSGANAIVIATNNAITFSNSTIHTGNATFSNTIVVTGVASFTDITASGTVAMASSFKRNRIINGNMLVWQRGTTGFATNNAYCADRWIAKADTTFTSASQSTDAPSGFKYSLSVSGTGYAGACQRIEALNCTDLSGQTVTISFWAKQTSGGGTNSLAVAINYPNSADVYAGGVTQIGATQYATGSSSWARYSFIFTGLPSGVLNGLNPYILSNVAGASTILITGVQIEVGTVATPYEMQIYSDQLAQCQRYYYQTTPSFGTLYGFANATGWVGSLVKFPVTMRVTPTMAVAGTFTSTNASGVNLVGVSPDGFSLYTTANATGNLILNPPASGPGITASAEL